MTGAAPSSLTPNADTIAAAIAMFRPAGALLLVAIDPRRTHGNVVGRTFHMPVDIEAAFQWCVERNNEGVNVYWTPNEARPMANKSSKADMVRAWYYWADCDPDVFRHGGYAGARAWLMENVLPAVRAKASIVIDSGHGLQAFFVLDQPIDLTGPQAQAQYEAVNRRLGSLYGSSGTHNCDRVMRMPGTINFPGAAKITKGYPEEPCPARLIAMDGVVWSNSEIESLVAREELHARLAETLAKHPAIRARWDGSKEGLNDSSGSALDQSLVTMLALVGWELDAIRAVLERWPHGSVGGRGQGDRYWDRMWANAQAARVAATPSVAIDYQALIGRISKPAERALDAPSAPPGLGRIIVDWIEATSRKPQPQFAIQAALAFASTILGRRVVTTRRNWPSLYFLNIGKSGSGKEHAKWAIEKLLDACGAERLIGPSNYTSDSGVLSSLVRQPAHIAVIDEFGKVLEAASVKQGARAQSAMRALMEAWGRCDGVLRPQGYSTFGMSHKEAEDLAAKTVRNPALALMAMTTPDAFFDTIGTAAARDGFLNRFLIVESDIGRQASGDGALFEIPQQIQDWAAAQMANAGIVNPALSASLVPTPRILDISVGAACAFRSFDAECIAHMNDLDDEGLAELWIRTCEIAMRLALIVSCLQGANDVTVEAAEWSVGYARYHAERTVCALRTRVADSDFQRACKQVRAAIVRAGERGLTEREISKACRLFDASRPRDRNDILATLARNGGIALARLERQSGRGTREAWLIVAQEDES